MRALIPYDYGVDLLGELPEGVSVDVWDTYSEPPEGAAEATFWVPPWETLDSYSDAIAKLPSLQVLQSMSAGYDHVLPQVPPDVTFCNARGVHDVAVAEWILAAILAMVRDLPDFVRRQAERRVEHTESDSLAGKTVLILGYGSIGQAVEQRLVPFEVTILRVASRAREGLHGPSDLPQLLPRADIVICLVPRSDATVGLIDSAFLAALPDGALVVNASRGALVDQDALLAELRSGRLRAALDVSDPDPLTPDHPLLAAPGLLYTPHVAGAIPQTQDRAFAFVGDQLRRHVRGEPLLNVIPH
jgi:phosphoglycerate dehydrogenase-like enzyme